MIIKAEFELEELPKTCSICPAFNQDLYNCSDLGYCFIINAYIQTDEASIKRHRLCMLKEKTEENVCGR